MKRAACLAWLLAACLSAAGCADDIGDAYGRMAIADGGNSVNGTSVLAGMFRQAGHEVSRTSWLAPKIRSKADVIVWAPDDFDPPSDEARAWFDDWFKSGPGKTLIYIGRDYDAAPAYWRAIQAGAPASQLPEIKRRLGGAIRKYLARRQMLPAAAQAEWFTVQGSRRHRRVRTLTAGPWRAGVDASKLGIELNSRLAPAAGAEVLLASRRDVIASRLPVHRGQLTLIANGSFLLNLPLVNHEHRKLAGQLIADARSGKKVVFLESGPGGPQLLEKDPAAVMRNGLEILTTTPFDRILLQLAVLGLVFCVSRFPIFGQPRELEASARSDFGKHVSALGTLMARTRDRAHAVRRIEHFQQHVRREPGKFRRASPSVAQQPKPAGDEQPAPPKPKDTHA
jgi:hypothetical protein